MRVFLSFKAGGRPSPKRAGSQRSQDVGILEPG